jgi:HlyD family secretion protein
MEDELKSLRIDRNRRRSPGESSKWARRWILGGTALFLLLGLSRFAYQKVNAATEVEVQRVRAASTSAGAPQSVVLNATGYIIAAHKIQLASKVPGKVAWIGVEKADPVKQGQELVRLEDDEYRAQLTQAKGALANLEAKLAEAMHGSRPEEVAQALANVESAKADLENARVTLRRTKDLATEGVLAKQNLDDAQAKYDSAQARLNALQKAYELVKLGPRQEQIDALRGQVDQARGAVIYAQTNLDNTVVRAPVTGTILERVVEKGEFVTTSFVGDKGAKGYVVSLADLNDLQVELDISQNDFARLHPKHRGIVTTDAYRDRKYDGFIYEISPEAKRQKATVQVKVKVENPDSYLRPEMNASVAFLADEKPAAAAGGGTAPAQAVILVPPSALRNDTVFVLLGGKAIERKVKAGATTGEGVRIESGLIGGEDLIVNPPAGLKDGDRVRRKG